LYFEESVSHVSGSLNPKEDAIKIVAEEIQGKIWPHFCGGLLNNVCIQGPESGPLLLFLPGSVSIHLYAL